MHDLVIHGHIIFAEIAVFARHIAMVGVDDYHGVLPHIVRVQEIQQLAQIGIQHGQYGTVIDPGLVNLILVPRLNLTVIGPVKFQGRVLVLVRLLPASSFHVRIIWNMPFCSRK